MKQRVLLLAVGLTVCLSYAGLGQSGSVSAGTGYIYPVPNGSSANRIWVIGQRPIDSQGQLVGKGDLVLQLRQIIDNIKTALASVKLSPTNIKQITYCVRQLDGQRTTLLNQVKDQYLPSSPGTLVQLKNIPQLIGEDMLIEVEIVAIGP